MVLNPMLLTRYRCFFLLSLLIDTEETLEFGREGSLPFVPIKGMFINFWPDAGDYGDGCTPHQISQVTWHTETETFYIYLGEERICETSAYQLKRQAMIAGWKALDDGDRRTIITHKWNDVENIDFHP